MSARGPRLLARQGRRTHWIRLTPGGVAVLGRSPFTRADDNSVSETHAKVETDATGAVRVTRLSAPTYAWAGGAFVPVPAGWLPLPLRVRLGPSVEVELVRVAGQVSRVPTFVAGDADEPALAARGLRAQLVFAGDKSTVGFTYGAGAWSAPLVDELDDQLWGALLAAPGDAGYTDADLGRVWWYAPLVTSGGRWIVVTADNKWDGAVLHLRPGRYPPEVAGNMNHVDTLQRRFRERLADWNRRLLAASAALSPGDGRPAPALEIQKLGAGRWRYRLATGVPVSAAIVHGFPR